MKTKYIAWGIFLFFFIGIIYSFTGILKNKTSKPTIVPKKDVAVPTTPRDTQVQGQIIVKFKQGYSRAQQEEHLKKYDATIIKTIEGINYTIIKVSPGQENAIIQRMKTDPAIEKALPDYTSHATFAPNDENYSLQYMFKNTVQTLNNIPGKAGADINAEQAWDVTRGAGVKVAILDSGIDINHPDLAGKIAVQRVFVSSTIDPDISDKNGHGTHVAGIIAANTNNNIGVAGTCPECQLIIGKVVTNDGTGNATGATSDIVSGITWATDQGAKVINLSLRSTSPQTQQLYQEGINYAMSKGVVVVAASGNDGSNAVTWPAGNDGVISVAATDNTDRMAPFSNYGAYVKVAAPGTFIASTFPTTPNAKKVLNYGYSSGTSMSSPIVAGIAALVWASPYGTSNTAVINRIYETADKIEGTGSQWTEGRVNAGKAVGYAPPSPTIPVEISAFPSINCMGGNAQPPCATMEPTQATNPQPELTESPEMPTQTPDSPPDGQLTQPPANNDNNESNPAPNEGNNSELCIDFNDLSYTNSYGNTEIQTYDHGGNGHRKHHGKGHGRHGGGFSEFFAMLFELILRLLEKMNIVKC